MAEWLFEDGIGERRAALVDAGAITAIGIERDSDGVRAGAIYSAKLTAERAGDAAIVMLDNGEEALCSALPRTLAHGASLLVEINRSAIPEADLVKRAKCRPAADDAVPSPGPDLLARFAATGIPVRTLAAHQPDALEAAGWSEALDEAASGHMPFDGGMLRMSLTPAMTVFDVDGSLPTPALAMAGARAVAAAIYRLDLAGSIVIDLPTLANKAERVGVAEAFDDALPPPFERTAINGYGLLQIIRRRVRPSIAERVQLSRIESAALAALRRAERSARTGPLTLVLNPAVADWLEAHPQHLAELAKRTARQPHLRGEPGRAMGAIDVA
jgi:hypothetical protein